jgi:hypothetical protein
MKYTLALIFCCFYSSAYLFSQDFVIDEGKSLNDIYLYQSTFFDLHKSFGNSIVKRKFEDKYHFSQVHSTNVDSVFYLKLGLLFLFDDYQLIYAIIFANNFEGITKKGLRIKLGETTIDDIMTFYAQDSVIIRSDNKYWFMTIRDSVNKGSITFYTKKHKEDFQKENPRNKIEHFDIMNYNWDFDMFFSKSRLICQRPRYALDLVQHFNCYKRGSHPLECHGLLNSPDTIYVGLYKSYHPTHQLKEVGNYKKGIKIGIWKFYDENGKLTKTIDYKDGLYQHKPFCWNNFFRVVIFMLVMITVIGIPLFFVITMVKIISKYMKHKT